MRKGFTLIELLAVIVILAIITIIAVPIVLNIIDDSKKNATLRSANFYLDAVEHAIASSSIKNQPIVNGTYNIMKNGNICIGTIIDNKCDKEIKVDITGEVPKEGKITIKDGKVNKINLILDNKIIVRGNDGTLSYSICKLIEDNNEIGITPGDKYQCKVKDNMETGYEDGYYFYVLSLSDDGKINLILDRNIYYDEQNDVGILGTATNNGKIEWNVSNKNGDGPVTAMDYLYNATKDWENVPNIEIDYTDKKPEVKNGYQKMITKDNITKIIKKDGTEAIVLGDKTGYKNLKVRMPIYEEVTVEGKCSLENDSCPIWLFNYLNKNESVTRDGFTNIRGIWGYWLLSSKPTDSVAGWNIYYSGKVSAVYANYTGFGVRPVITLEM